MGEVADLLNVRLNSQPVCLVNRNMNNAKTHNGYMGRGSAVIAHASVGFGRGREVTDVVVVLT